MEIGISGEQFFFTAEDDNWYRTLYVRTIIRMRGR